MKTFSIYKCSFCFSENAENLNFYMLNGIQTVICFTCNHYIKKNNSLPIKNQTDHDDAYYSDD